MPKSVHTDAYARVIEYLIRLRTERGVSQVELAERLGKTQQFVSRVELRVRRIDVVEFYAIVRALGLEPATAAEALFRTLPTRVEI